MKITAYPLYGPAATLQPSPEGRGWDFLCPCAFEAVWHGGPGAGDVEIRLAENRVPGEVDFVQSLEGEGLLTFFPGYQCKTEAEHALWVRGPINASKDGAVPLESVIDTSILPGTLTLHWRLTRPGQTLRFEAGEPFCTILSYPKAGLDEVTVEVMPLTGGVDDYERALESLAESQALESVFQRLGAGDYAGSGAWHREKPVGRRSGGTSARHLHLPGRGPRGAAGRGDSFLPAAGLPRRERAHRPQRHRGADPGVRPPRGAGRQRAPALSFRRREAQGGRGPRFPRSHLPVAGGRRLPGSPAFLHGGPSRAAGGFLEGRQGLALEWTTSSAARNPRRLMAARFMEEVAFGAKRSSRCMAIRTPRPMTPAGSRRCARARAPAPSTSRPWSRRRSTPSAAARA